MAKLNKFSDKNPYKQQKKREVTPINAFSYLKDHYKDAIAYFFLVIGILLLFFSVFYGQIIVGFIAGLYFCQEMIGYLLKWSRSIALEEMGKNLVFAGTCVALLILIPSFSIGIAIAMIVKLRT